MCFLVFILLARLRATVEFIAVIDAATVLCCAAAVAVIDATDRETEAVRVASLVESVVETELVRVAAAVACATLIAAIWDGTAAIWAVSVETVLRKTAFSSRIAVVASIVWVASRPMTSLTVLSFIARFMSETSDVSVETLSARAKTSTSCRCWREATMLFEVEES
jgi:hypothetical protein